MKTYVALSMLTAARDDGIIPDEEDAVKRYGKQSIEALKQIGLTDEELNSEYPQDTYDHAMFLVCNEPTVWAAQIRASASWLIHRN